MAFLVNRHEVEAHQTTVSLHRGRELRIGRGTGVDLRLDDPSVDFQHATIERLEGGRFLLRDLGGRGGTWVGNEAVGERRLESGDVITIGGFRLTVEVVGSDNPLLVRVTRDAELAVARAAGLSEADTLRQTGAVALPAAAVPAAVAFVPRGPRRRRRDGGATPPFGDAYRLAGAVKPWTLAFVLGAVAAGVVAVLVLRGGHAFSPGPLAHPEASLAGQGCAACHGQPPAKATAAGCAAAGCHADVGEHQPDLAAAPSCLVCHREHQGAEGLRLAGSQPCVECHGKLEEAGGTSGFAPRIVAFAPGEHPEVAIEARDLDGMRRVRLDEPGARELDDVAVGFPHAWHLEMRRGGVEVLSCRSCHRDDGEGEMQPIAFADTCARCHALDFDPRLAEAVAPHAEPAAVLAALRETYAAHPELAADPTPEERRRFAGRRLGAEARLDAMARLAAETLVAKKCVGCHAVRPPDLRAELEALAVEPAGIRRRWLPHARFRHGPHVELAECVDCHRGAASSRQSRDVLVPSLETCFGCHRPAEEGEDPVALHLGPTTCAPCHGFHPDRGEGEAAAQGSKGS